MNAKATGERLVRTSVLVPAKTDATLRELAAEGKRPLSWEIRQALENHVELALEDRCKEFEAETAEAAA